MDTLRTEFKYQGLLNAARDTECRTVSSLNYFDFIYCSAMHHARSTAEKCVAWSKV